MLQTNVLSTKATVSVKHVLPFLILGFQLIKKTYREQNLISLYLKQCKIFISLSFGLKKNFNRRIDMLLNVFNVFKY